MLIGYARVSTHDQNLDLQQDALYAAGCEKIFADELSGAKAARPELEKAMDSLREGDVLVVWRLDRLGRSLRNLLEWVEKLKERKVGFRSIQESMDTSTSGGNLIFQVFGALADRCALGEPTDTALHLRLGRFSVFAEGTRRVGIDI